MSDCIAVTIEADKGATVTSPNFFGVEEILPPDTTVADVEDGILNGTYTPIDPNLYTYEGKVASDYGQATIVDLNLTISTVTIEGTPSNGGTDTYQVVTFKIPPSETTTWDNREQTLIFDVKRTLISDLTEVDIWVRGKIQVNPVITE